MLSSAKGIAAAVSVSEDNVTSALVGMKELCDGKDSSLGYDPE